MKELLRLKQEYKTLAGKDWKPDSAPSVTASATSVTASATSVTTSAPPAATTDALNQEIVAQGNKVRDLKASKAGKVCVALSDLINKY